MLYTGIPEIGVPHFEPLHIDQVSVSRGSGNLNLQGGFHDLIVHGPSNTTVRRASLDMEQKALEFDLDIPRLRINAQYNLKGQILLLPIIGNGDVAMTLKNVKTRVVTKFSLQNMPEVRIHLNNDAFKTIWLSVWSINKVYFITYSISFKFCNRVKCQVLI